MSTFVLAEETEYAYWAGIFDGEGHVRLLQQPNSGSRSVREEKFDQATELRKNGWTEAIQ